MATEQIIDLSNPHQKRLLLDGIREMEGVWRFEWCRFRPRRGDRQNALYWVAVVQPFADFLREQGETYTKEDAHEVLRAKFLRESIINKETGEVIGERVRSTASLDTAEFSEYLDQCVAWLSEMFGIECHMPDPNAMPPRKERPTPIHA